MQLVVRAHVLLCKKSGLSIFMFISSNDGGGRNFVSLNQLNKCIHKPFIVQLTEEKTIQDKVNHH